jgi:hypothetical protein
MDIILVIEIESGGGGGERIYKWDQNRQLPDSLHGLQL